MMLNLIFVDEVESSFKADEFLPLIRGVEKRVERIPETEVEFLLTGDAPMQQINKQSRGLDQPTDVLSFANREIEDDGLKDPHSLGQIVISLPAAQRNADQMQQSLEEEVRFLFVHGLLHILGYDHQTPEEEFEMMSLAYEVLGRPPYQRHVD